MLMLLANQRPALKWIASARRRKYDAVCLLSKNIATRPMRPFRPLRSSVRVPSNKYFQLNKQFLTFILGYYNKMFTKFQFSGMLHLVDIHIVTDISEVYS